MARLSLITAPSGCTGQLTCPTANALEPSQRRRISGRGESQTEGQLSSQPIIRRKFCPEVVYFLKCNA
jgi:hypothetical protein